MAKVIIIEPDITEEENQRRWNIVKEILHEIDKEIVRENTEVNNWKTGWIAFKEIEKRAAEIGNIIDTDPNADTRSLNIELDGLKEAKENIETRKED